MCNESLRTCFFWFNPPALSPASPCWKFFPPHNPAVPAAVFLGIFSRRPVSAGIDLVVLKVSASILFFKNSLSSTCLQVLLPLYGLSQKSRFRLPVSIKCRHRRSGGQYRPRRVKKQGGQPKLSAPSQGLIPGSPFIPMTPRLKPHPCSLIPTASGTKIGQACRICTRSMVRSVV